MSLSVSTVIWNFLFASGAIQGLFLMIVLIRHPIGNKAANRILAFLVLMVAFILVENVIRDVGFYKDLPHAIFSTTAFWYLISPTLYFYVCFLSGNKQVFKTIDVLHLIPFVLAFADLMRFYPLPGEIKIGYFEQMSVQKEITLGAFITVSFLLGQIAIYSVLGLKKLKQTMTSITKKTLNIKTHFLLLKRLLILLIIFGVFDFSVFLANSLFENSPKFLQYLVLMGMSILNYSIAYLAIKYPLQLFPQMKIKPRYENSALSEKSSKEYLLTLEELMQKEQLFLDSELSLQNLAERLNISQYHLSQLLNQELGVNFYDFVNRFRIAEAQHRFSTQSYNHLSILAVCYDVGFKSKSVFNQSFKKFVGMTPSEFRKNHELA